MEFQITNDSRYIGFDSGQGDLPGCGKLHDKTLWSLWKFGPRGYLDAFLITLYDKLYHSLQCFITFSKHKYVALTDHSIATSNGGRTFVSFCGISAAGNVLSSDFVPQGCEDFALAATAAFADSPRGREAGDCSKKVDTRRTIACFLVRPTSRV
jgi:hypothetical protein